MSKDSKSESKSESKPKAGKKKTIIFAVGGLAMLGVGAGAGMYFGGALGHKAEPEDPNRPKLVERLEHSESEGGEGGESKETPLRVGTVSVKDDQVRVDPRKFEATYVPLESTFTANLAGGAGFVQMSLSLATYYDGKVILNVKHQLVPIRSAILLVLSQQDAGSLATPDGKARLQKELTAAINKVLKEKEGFGGIDNVYFTNLVIQ